MEKTAFSGLIVIIPTRNRAELAKKALQSVLEQGLDNVFVVVSDNSTDAAQSADLASYCQQYIGANVVYMVPPAPLAMCPHWDWALSVALERFAVSHIVFLTDRMVFLPGALQTLLKIIARYPDRVISYNQSRINDLKTPVSLEEVSWTDKLLQIPSRDILALAARISWQSSLPRLLNSVAPRRILHDIKEKFGDVCNSTAPDMSFAFRCLEREDSILYYDKALNVHYALERSNGESQSRGVATQDHRDFLANLGSKPLNFAAPIPQIDSVANTILHEYNLVKNATGSPKFPEIDKRRYLEHIVHEANHFESESLRRETLSLVKKHESEWNIVVTANLNNKLFRRIVSLARKIFGFKSLSAKLWTLAYISRPQFLWRTLKRLGMGIPALVEIREFPSVAEALAHASQNPRPRSWGKGLVEVTTSAKVVQRRVLSNS